MEEVDVLIIGGGITGLSLASFLKKRDYLVLEKSQTLGGYCKTKIAGDFVWDYSGHFFHFKNDEIKNYIFENMESEVMEVKKITDIYYNGQIIDFPFQHNIHQLNKKEYEECLTDLENCNQVDNTSFKSFVKSTLGNGICDKFIIPYNQKLYACDLDTLEYDSMGRFFPSRENKKSYNETFIYPKKGSYEYIKSILKRLDPEKVLTHTEVLSLDLDKKIARTNLGTYKFNSLVSTLPFDVLLGLLNQENDLSANKVVVFNLGFDKGTDIKTHWRYFPNDEVFYRVGFYNNILNQDKLSLYVEIGLTQTQETNQHELLKKVLLDLKKVDIIDDHKLMDFQFLIMNPAYVHITESSKKTYDEWAQVNNPNQIYSIGRYGCWTYCSIEDNIIQAKETAQILDNYL